MLDTVKINHVQHISFTQSRLTDAVSVILSELLSYEHPSNGKGLFLFFHIRLQTFFYFVPVNHRKETVNISVASVLIVQIVCVFPNINQ